MSKPVGHEALEAMREIVSYLRSEYSAGRFPVPEHYVDTVEAALQASQPVCEHNHTVRHAYSHIPQGYDECSLCGATRVEGEDWRTPNPAATEGERCATCNHTLFKHDGERVLGVKDWSCRDCDCTSMKFQPTETEA